MILFGLVTLCVVLVLTLLGAVVVAHDSPGPAVWAIVALAIACVAGITVLALQGAA